MRPSLSILTVDPRDGEGLARVREFAASFDHQIKAPHMPVHLLLRGERPFAFFQRMPMVVCSPNFHTDPTICTPRDVLEGGTLMVESARFMDGACVVEADPRGKFTPEIMAHLGLIPRNTVLFQKA